MSTGPRSESDLARETDDFLRRLEESLVDALSSQGLGIEGRVERRTAEGLLFEIHFHVANRRFELYAGSLGLTVTDSEGESEWTKREKLEEPKARGEYCAELAREAAREEPPTPVDAQPGCGPGLLILLGFGVLMVIAIQLPDWITGGAHDTKLREWNGLHVRQRSEMAGESLELMGELADSRFAIDRIEIGPSAHNVRVTVRVKRGADGGRRLAVRFPIRSEVTRVSLNCSETLWSRP